MSTSLSSASRRTNAWSAGSWRSAATDRLPRDWTRCHSDSSPPALSPHRRSGSPDSGCSILMTSAPKSANHRAAKGPAMSVPSSRTRRSDSGPAMRSRRSFRMAGHGPRLLDGVVPGQDTAIAGGGARQDGADRRAGDVGRHVFMDLCARLPDQDPAQLAVSSLLVGLDVPQDLRDGDDDAAPGQGRGAEAGGRRERRPAGGVTPMRCRSQARRGGRMRRPPRVASDTRSPPRERGSACGRG